MTREEIDTFEDILSWLKSYVKHEYGWPDVHPALARKYDRDMSEIEEARKVLNKYE